MKTKYSHYLMVAILLSTSCRSANHYHTRDGKAEKGHAISGLLTHVQGHPQDPPPPPIGRTGSQPSPTGPTDNRTLKAFNFISEYNTYWLVHKSISDIQNPDDSFVFNDGDPVYYNKKTVGIYINYQTADGKTKSFDTHMKVSIATEISKTNHHGKLKYSGEFKRTMPIYNDKVFRGLQGNAYLSYDEKTFLSQPYYYPGRNATGLKPPIHFHGIYAQLVDIDGNSYGNICIAFDVVLKKHRAHDHTFPYEECNCRCDL